METGITFELEAGREEFAPAEALRGVVSWESANPEDRAELSVLWYTEGKGDKDTGLAHFEEFKLDSQNEHRFEIALPLLPLTYYGELLKIHWVCRLRVDRKASQDLVLDLPFVLRAAASVSRAV
jgi:hypothetical protein